jgi:hypothetical protein
MPSRVQATTRCSNCLHERWHRRAGERAADTHLHSSVILFTNGLRSSCARTHSTSVSFILYQSMPHIGTSKMIFCMKLLFTQTHIQVKTTTLSIFYSPKNTENTKIITVYKLSKLENVMRSVRCKIKTCTI